MLKFLPCRGTWRALLVVVAAAIAVGCAELRTPYTNSELQIGVPMGVAGVDAPLSVLRGWTGDALYSLVSGFLLA